MVHESITLLEVYILHEKKPWYLSLLVAAPNNVISFFSCYCYSGFPEAVDT